MRLGAGLCAGLTSAALQSFLLHGISDSELQ